jgi:hypothetical protein
VKRSFQFFLLLIISALTLSCITIATPTPSLDLMSTVGALQTDVAAATGTIGAALSLPSATPQRTPTTPPSTVTPTPKLSSPTPTVIGIKSDHAEFVSETIPDGSVMAPGAVFRKSWRLINRGKTTWNVGYSLVFLDGYQLGAPEVIHLSQDVPPDRVINLSINLKAPDTKGEYTGYWMLRNTDGVNFGIGLNDDPFSVNIIVGDPWETSNGPLKSIIVDQLTKLENPYDCFTGVQITFKGTIVVNSPGEVAYVWQHNGINSGLIETYRFTAAGEKFEVYHEWTINTDTLGAVDLAVLKPYGMVSNIKEFEITCK